MKTKNVKPGKFAHRGGTLVLGVPNLQDTFDHLRSGGGLVLRVENYGPFLVKEIVMVSEDRLDEIITTLPVDRSQLN